MAAFPRVSVTPGLPGAAAATKTLSGSLSPNPEPLFFHPALLIPLSVPCELHSQPTLPHAIIQWSADGKSAFVKAKLSSGITSPPKNHISHHKLDTSSACFRENEPSWGQAQHWGACTDLQKDWALCVFWLVQRRLNHQWFHGESWGHSEPGKVRHTTFFLSWAQAPSQNYDWIAA